MTTDRYGREWDLPANELCPECGQPDNVGDCDHTPLSDKDAQTLAGENLRDKIRRLQVEMYDERNAPDEDAQTLTLADESDRFLATVTRAEPEAVQMILDAPVETGDGRSGWRWVRFANGDLALAVFPQGDTYFALEEMGVQA